MSEKLQKVLARAGLGSRRQLEQWISEGRVIVNGKPATLGDRIGENDKVFVDGKPVTFISQEAIRTRVLAYYKPEGEICSRSDPEGRPTIFDRLPRLRGARWVAVGRLDINTQGLILLTNNGELANRLMHPSSEVEREYAVRVKGEADAEVLNRLRTGVNLDDGPAHFDTVREQGGSGSNHWYHVTLREGRNREVRRLWESQGFLVSRLVRVRYHNINLQRGQEMGGFLELDADQVSELMRVAKLEEPPREVEQPQPRAKTMGRKYGTGSGRNSGKESGPRRDRDSEQARPSARKPSAGKPAAGRSRPSAGKPAAGRGRPAAGKPASGRARPSNGKPTTGRGRSGKRDR